MDRQKKFQKQMKKGIKQFEKQSKREYDHYGRINTRKEQYPDREEKSRSGCRNFVVGFFKFIIWSIVASVISMIAFKVISILL